MPWKNLRDLDRILAAASVGSPIIRIKFLQLADRPVWPIKGISFLPPAPVFPQFFLQCNTVQESRNSKMSDQLVELIWCKKWWGRTIVWDTHRQLLPPTPPQSTPPPASDGWPDCLLINWIVSLINGHDKGETGGYATTLLYLHRRIPPATCIFQALNRDFCKHGVCTEI